MHSAPHCSPTKISISFMAPQQKRLEKAYSDAVELFLHQNYSLAAAVTQNSRRHQQTDSSQARKQCTELLIYDGYRSHMSFQALKILLDGNVEAYALPSHTSGITQPLDVSVFAPFKHHINKELYKKRLFYWHWVSSRNIFFSTCVVCLGRHTNWLLLDWLLLEETFAKVWKKQGRGPFVLKGSSLVLFLKILTI